MFRRLILANLGRTIVGALVFHAASASHAEVHAVLVGCSYMGSPGIPKLTCAENDVRLFSMVVKAPSNAVQTITPATGRLITRKRILEAIQAGVNECREGDTFVFFFSGHGESTGRSSFLVPEDVPLDDCNPTRDYVAVAEIRAAIARSCKARQAFLVLDACYSGGSRFAPTPSTAPHERTQIYTFAATSAYERAYETSTHYSVFTLALVQSFSHFGEEIGDASGLPIDEIRRDISERVRTLCDREKRKRQDPFIDGPGPVTVKEIVSAPAIREILPKPLGDITELARLKRGIGVLFKCTEAANAADRLASAVRQKLLDCQYPVFGPERSTELATVIDAASSLEGRKLAADLTDRLLTTGEVHSLVGETTYGGQTFKTVSLSISMRVVDLQGNIVLEYSSDLSGGPATNYGATEESALSAAIRVLIERMFKVIKPKIDAVVTERMIDK